AYLDRYFLPTRNGYEVKSELRDMVRFSSQSVIKDPPFSKIDLVTCRNLLIYFDHALQDLALHVFHYALRPGGYLMLGPSEAIRGEADLFEDLAVDHRLYRRNRIPARPLDLPRVSRLPSAPQSEEQAENANLFGLPIPAVTALLERHMPPYLIIGPKDEVLQIGPGAEPYVHLTRGRMSMSLRDLILPSLEGPIKRLMTGLAIGGGEYRQISVDDAGPGLPKHLTIAAEVMTDGSRLLTFDMRTAESHPTSGKPGHLVVDEAYVGQLEDQLEEAQRTVRSTVEELETSNEELKSSNEEMMSMNEELQSANEELSTANEELQNKLVELAEVNADLANFMESTQIATVFLDEKLRLRNFTPEAVAWFRFVDQDRGRALTDIGARLDMDQVAAHCRRVVQNGEAFEERMESNDGSAAVILRFAPYRAAMQGTGGVVFSIFDVTDLTHYARAAEEAGSAARASAEEVEALYFGNPAAMGLVDRDYRY
ncbi:chemotaxis protein CheR, partial [Thioclava sp. BHET1]